MFKSIADIFSSLGSQGVKKRMITAWGVDSHTVAADSRAVSLQIVDVTLVGDRNRIEQVCTEEGIDIGKFEVVHVPEESSAVAQAVNMVRDGHGDLLMKGLCSTDKFIRAILDKERGLPLRRVPLPMWA